MKRFLLAAALLLALATPAMAGTQTGAPNTLDVTPTDANGNPWQTDTLDRLIVRGIGSSGLTDKSGSVTTGGTSQVAYSGASGLIYVFVQNPIDATETLFVNFGAAASTTAKTSYELAPGASLTFSGGFIPINSINVTAATTGHKFIIKVA